MSANNGQQPSEQESRDVAEAARETEWTAPSFVRELFLGNFRLDLIHPYPQQSPEDKAKTDAYIAKLRPIIERVDSDEIDRTGELPAGRRPGAARGGRVRPQDPRGVRRHRAEPGGLRPHHRHGDQQGRQPHRPPFGAPVHRRSPAAQAVRHAGAEEEVPAPHRQGRHLGVRADGGRRGLGPGRAQPPRRRPARTARSSSSTARSCGAPTAPWPSCWW